MSLAAMTYNLSLTSQAAATIGTDADWDAAVSSFLRTYSLWQADEHYGAYAKANDEWDRSRMSLERRYGKGWDRCPAAQEELKLSRDVLRAAEDIHHQRYVVPYWAALRQLAETPAPSIAAAAFKSLLIRFEEIWNDSEVAFDCMQIVAADWARLAT